jgi:predicted HAD superfamily Cof-like phosphohydrolase
MNNIFDDQKLFMDVCGQGKSSSNELLYYNLIKEEVGELIAAWEVNDRVEIADACIDILYVTIGMMHSMGLNPQPFWDEVQRSNMSKFFLEPNGSYTCLRRTDGKILKPDTYSPPDLETIYKEQCGD